MYISCCRRNSAGNVSSSRLEAHFANFDVVTGADPSNCELETAGFGSMNGRAPLGDAWLFDATMCKGTPRHFK